MTPRHASARITLAAALGLVLAAPVNAELNARKLDVLCRGGHGTVKLEPYSHWCAGYARGILDALGGDRRLEPRCLPADEQVLWDRFGEWLVSGPVERRELPAVDAVVQALRERCS